MLRMGQYKHQIFDSPHIKVRSENLNASKRHQMKCLLILHVLNVSYRGCSLLWSATKEQYCCVQLKFGRNVLLPDIDECVILSRKCEEKRCKAVFRHFSVNKLNSWTCLFVLLVQLQSTEQQSTLIVRDNPVFHQTYQVTSQVTQ